MPDHTSHRRFPPPWQADRIPGGYVVRDANGQAIAYIYGRSAQADAMQANVLTMDEARRWRSTSRSCRTCYGEEATNKQRRGHDPWNQIPSATIEEVC